MQHPGLMEIARRDSRFAYEAYEFLFEALVHTQRRLGREPPENPDEPPGDEYHVGGVDLVDGFLDLALQRFGRLARVVLRVWGVNRTDDIGELVFNLIEAGLLSKTDSDRQSDFDGLRDLDEVLVNGFQITLER